MITSGEIKTSFEGFPRNTVFIFRDELTSERDIESTYYLYERGGLLFGHYTDGSWHFGLKVRSYW